MTRSQISGMSIYRVGLFIPQIMSAVVVGVIWRWLFAFDGPINLLLEQVGLAEVARPWLGDFTYARTAVGIVGSWVQYGLVMVLFISGAQSIDDNLYDAARVFGANVWQEFRYVTVPGLRQQIFVAFILTFIAALRLFDLVFVLTRRGGPGKETTVVSLLIYEEAFQYNNAGYASAMAVVLAIIILSISAIVIQSQLQQDEKEIG
jgi:raffinose/stachyose/melibiose transport system permease protein